MIAPMAGSILLIDDDPAFRRLARQTLNGSGLTVVGEAATAAEGSSAARSLKPQIVLVDVGLPDGDGLSLAVELSALPWGPRVVLTSVDPDAASPEEVRKSGAIGFVPKQDLPGSGLDMLMARE
jgi:DNA-binding NarL/FixJ family response regulator